jgi:hypothetical protein
VRWANAEYDRLWKQAATELDPVKRAALFIRMNDLVIEDVVVIPVVWRHDVLAVSHSLRSLALGPWGFNLWELAYWYREARERLPCRVVLTSSSPRLSRLTPCDRVQYTIPVCTLKTDCRKMSDCCGDDNAEDLFMFVQLANPRTAQRGQNHDHCGVGHDRA